MKAGGVQFADTPGRGRRRTPRPSSSSRSAGTCRAACWWTRSAQVKQEYYAGVVWDGTRKRPLMLFCDMGGIDIEQVAEEHPDHVGRGHFSNLLPFSDFQAKQAIADAGVTGSALNRLTPILARLARLFRDRDMTLAEINPLAQLEDGSFVALDAHMEMENEAMPRQKAVLAELGIDETRARARATSPPPSRPRSRRSTRPTTAA